MKCAAVEEVNNLMLPVAAAKQIAVGENLQFNISGGDTLRGNTRPHPEHDC